MSKQVFISYAREDSTYVQKIASGLQYLKHEVWYDDVFVGGEEWWRTILERISWCDVFLFAVSDYSSYSGYCGIELDYALKCRRPVLPVRVRPLRQPAQVAPVLKDLHAIVYNADEKMATLELLRAVADVPTQPYEQDSLPTPPALPSGMSRLGSARPRVALVERRDMEYDETTRRSTGPSRTLLITDENYRGVLEFRGGDWGMITRTVSTFLDGEPHPVIGNTKSAITLWIPTGRQFTFTFDNFWREGGWNWDGLSVKCDNDELEVADLTARADRRRVRPRRG